MPLIFTHEKIGSPLPGSSRPHAKVGRAAKLMPIAMQIARPTAPCIQLTAPEKLASDRRRLHASAAWRARARRRAAGPCPARRPPRRASHTSRSARRRSRLARCAPRRRPPRSPRARRAPPPQSPCAVRPATAAVLLSVLAGSLGWGIGRVRFRARQAAVGIRFGPARQRGGGRACSRSSPPGGRDAHAGDTRNGDSLPSRAALMLAGMAPVLLTRSALTCSCPRTAHPLDLQCRGRQAAH